MARGRGRPPKGSLPIEVSRHIEQTEALQKAYARNVLHPPEGMPEGWVDGLGRQIENTNRYYVWLSDDERDLTDEPDVPEVDKRAARMAMGRAPGGWERRRNAPKIHP